MQQAGLPSFRALSRNAEVSDWQVKQLRCGKIAQLRLITLVKLSQALKISLNALLENFSGKEVLASDIATPEINVSVAAADPEAEKKLASLKQEYCRLQTQLEQQRQTLWQEFQHASVQVLESWLLQWPTAAYAAHQNPNLPATKLLPLLGPVEQLIEQWDLVAIAPVGAELPYDPSCQQLIAGHVQPGELVKVRYTGYRQGNNLLYRAKVSPISPIDA